MGSAWEDRSKRRALRSANSKSAHPGVRLTERGFLVLVIAPVVIVGCIVLGWVAGSGVHF